MKSKRKTKYPDHKGTQMKDFTEDEVKDSLNNQINKLKTKQEKSYT